MYISVYRDPYKHTCIKICIHTLENKRNKLISFISFIQPVYECFLLGNTNPHIETSDTGYWAFLYQQIMPTVLRNHCTIRHYNSAVPQNIRNSLVLALLVYLLFFKETNHIVHWSFKNKNVLRKQKMIFKNPSRRRKKNN